MASFDINEVARRVQSTSTGQDGPYTFNFQVNAASEIQVFRNDTLQTESTHYNTTLNADGTGSITFIDTSGSGGTDHSPTSGDVITIIGDQPLSRTTVFSTGSVNQPATLETEFDNVVIRQQQLKEMMDRSIQLKASTRRTVTGTGTSGPLQFPYDDTASNNANKIIKFDSNGTALELGSTTTNIDTLAGVSTEIGLLGTSGNVTAMGLLGTSAVVADMALLGNSDVIADMALLADSAVIADMAILATTDVVSDLNTLATSDIVSDINTLATSDIVSDLNTLATSDIVSDLNTLATSDIVSDINTLATSDVVSDLNTLATSDFVSDLNTLASSTVVSNIATVATNVAGVTSFAERYRVGSSDPSSDNDAGDLFFNTSSNTLKFFNGSSYNAITSGIADDEVTTAKIADSAVTTAKIADNAVTTAKINADAITGAKIADDAINSEHYTDGSIDTAHIADNQITNAKMADDSVGSAELIDNSVGAAALNISGNGTSGQMVVSDGDGSFSYADASSGGGFTPTTLSGTSQSLNVGSFNFFNGGTHGGDTTLSFASVPTEANWKYTYKVGGTAFRLDSFIHHKHFAPKELEGSSLDDPAGVRDIKFKPDGTIMYVLSEHDCVIYQYTLSTAFDVSSATYANKKYELSTDHISGFGLKSDGSVLFFFSGHTSGNRTFKNVPLSTPFDISTDGTRSNSSSFTQTDAGNFKGMHINSDGTKVFMCADTGSDQKIFRYDFSSGFDVSTASHAQTLTLTTGSVNLRGFAMSDDLTRIFSIDLDNDYVVEHSLASAGDLTSTLTYEGTHNIPQEITIPNGGGLAFGDSGKKFYIGSRSHETDINQFRVGKPHGLTLPSAVDNRLSPRDNFVPDDQVTLEFFTTNSGTNVTIIGDDVT